MGFFSKKYKFYIRGIGEEFIHYEEVIKPAIRGPKWFAGLCPFVRKKKKAIDVHPLPVTKTAKSCPGMLDLFKNSFLIQFPCDLILKTESSGKFSWQKPSKTQVLRIINPFSPDQIEFNEPLSSFIMVKFCLPFIFQTPNNKVSLIDPTYWKNQPYKIAPGILDFKKDREALPLNFVALFEKKDKAYEFKKGEPMGLYYTLHKSTMEVKEDLEDSLLRQDLNRTFPQRW